jgi:hypothetical protein
MQKTRIKANLARFFAVAGLALELAFGVGFTDAPADGGNYS